MAKTVVGLMQSTREAQEVVNDLSSTCGCDRNDIGLMARGASETGATSPGNAEDAGDSGGAASGAMKGAGVGAAAGGILGLVAGAASLAIPGLGPIIAAGPIASALAGAGIGAVAGGTIGALTNLGVPEEEAHYYAEGVRRGGTLITVHAEDDTIADCAAGVMRAHGAMDIDEQAAEWKKQGWSGRIDEGAYAGESGQAAAGGRMGTGRDEAVLPVTEESLSVGKRQVDVGAVRVYARVTEQPVQETVNLREERVEVERRPVDRPLEASEQAFQEGEMEIEETREEPVVQKTARVVEEVAVRKEERERQATINDTVRRTDVEVEKAGAGSSAGTGAGTGMGTGSSTYGGVERRKSRAAYRGAERRAAMMR